MDQDFGITAIMRQSGLKLSKILWIIVLSASLWCLGYYVSENYIKLNINPEILIKGQHVNSRTIPFPAVTICPPYAIKLEFLNVSKFFENIQQGIIPELKDRKIMTAFSHICTQYFLNLESYPNLTSTSENMVDIFNKMSAQIEDFFDFCVVGRYIECKKMFIRSLTTLGNCFTFNLVGYHSLFNANLSADFDGYKRKYIAKSWSSDAVLEYHDDDDKDIEPSNWTIHKGYASNDDWVQPLRAAGLQSFRIGIKIQKNEFSNLCETSFNSHRAILHLPDEIPTFSNVYSAFLIGDFRYMRITAEIQKIDESLKKYSTDFRKCYFEDERQLKFLKSYTKLNCELECMTNFTFETCGCVAYWMPRTNDTKVCEFDRNVCFRGIFYRWSSSYYESEQNKRNFPDFPCNCYPTCTRIKYSIINEFSVKRTQKSANSTSSGFQLAFGDSQILESTNYVTYKIQNFVSDIGGLAGLFLGFSLLSLFEIVLRSIAIFKNFIRKSTCLRVDKSTLTQKQTNKPRKRRTNRTKKKKIQDKSSSDLVIIDMVFGEQIEASH